MSSYWYLWRYQNSRRQFSDNWVLFLKRVDLSEIKFGNLFSSEIQTIGCSSTSHYVEASAQDMIIVLFFSFVVGESSWLDISSFVWCYHTESGFSCRRLSLCDDKLLLWALVKIVYLLHCGWNFNRIQVVLNRCALLLSFTETDNVC